MSQQYFRHTPLPHQTFETRQDYYERLPLAEDPVDLGPRLATNESRGESAHVEIPPGPVYVVTDRSGDSILMYDSRMMEEGERYPIQWNGEHLLLVKEDGEIAVYKRQV